MGRETEQEVRVVATEQMLVHHPNGMPEETVSE